MKKIKTITDLIIKNFSLMILAISLISCRDEDSNTKLEEDLMPEKINYGWTIPDGMWNPETDNNYHFTYDNNKRLINKKGGFLPLIGTTGFSGLFSKSVNTKIIYENNKATSSDYVDDPNLAIQPNNKVYMLLNNQIIEKYVPSNNPIFDKKLSYKYTNSKLTEIITRFPNMPYDPKNPSDYVLTSSEKFEYDNNGNLIKSVLVSKHNDVIDGGRKETIFGNYDNAKNPFKKLYLLEEYFYKSLSKNNYRHLLIKSYDQNNNLTSFSESSWEFSYDSNGNIILTK